MIDKSNHGQVGDVLFVRMTEQKFADKCSKGFDKIKNLTVLTPELINSGYFGWISAGCPIYIDNNAQGDYEIVCENGVEVHEWE